MFSTLDLTASHSAHPNSGNREDGKILNAPSRPKRDQVRRACDWCKLMRIKCDNDRPCYNCQQGGRECEMTNRTQFRSFAAAVKEVEALRAQVRELETSKRHLEKTQQSGTPSSSSVSTSSLYSVRQTASRDGVRLDSILWGITTLPFFLKRFDGFLRNTRPYLNVDMTSCAAGTVTPSRLLMDDLSSSFLPIYQERHFLSLFWQTYYFSYPILNEAQFRREYQDLAAESSAGARRKPSPLNDIVLALCMQQGSLRSNQARNRKASLHKTIDLSLAGYQYYLRCQQFINEAIEAPSLRTVQCYVYSIVYLLEAGLLNRAQVVTGEAITIGILLGLSNEPPPEMAPPEREVCRRTWWSLYSLDTLLSMEVGRPPMINDLHSTSQMPTDSLEVTQWLAPHYRHNDTCPPWVGFQTQLLHLLRAVRTARTAFYATYDAVVGQDGHETFVNNSDAREECAQSLLDTVKEIDKWASDVPRGYVMPRKYGREFSTDPFTLDLDPNPNILVHCQRQRLLLELQYFSQYMALYQPFICFSATADSSTPLSDGMALSALRYAIALTDMLHQALTGSVALSGAYSAFRLQKNALFTIIGYAYTFPLFHSRDAISEAIDKGLTVVDMYQDVLSDARTVAAAVRALSDDLANVMEELGEDDNWSSFSWLAAPAAIAVDQHTAGMEFTTASKLGKQDQISELGAPIPTSPGTLAGTIDGFSPFNWNAELGLGDVDAGFDHLAMPWGLDMDLGESSNDSWDIMDIVSMEESGNNDKTNP